jgi:hypothetical protein
LLPMRKRYAASLVVLAFALVACDGSDEPKRGVVSISTATVGRAPLTLVLFVSSCHGSPIATVTETTDRVRVRVISTTSKNGPACADAVTLTLSRPLGTRAVEDLSSHKVLAVRR